MEDAPRVASLVLPTGETVLFNATDEGLVVPYSWVRYSTQGVPYAQARIDGKVRSLHRWLLGEPEGLDIDHRNGDGLDNRRENLRTCTPSQNGGNRRSMGGSSRFKGVSWYKRGSNWQAIIGSGPPKYLGRFADEIQAALTYDAAARERWGEFAAVNFPNVGERSALTGDIREPSHGNGGEACEGCGSVDCDQFGLCDVSFDNYQPVAATHGLEARREIAAAWGGHPADLDDISIITLAVDELLSGERASGMALAPAVYRQLRAGCTLHDIAKACNLDATLIPSMLYNQDASPSPSAILAVEADIRLQELSFRQIAKKHGVSEDMVTQFAAKIDVKSGFDNRRYTEEQIAEVWRLHDEGLTGPEASERMGLHEKAAWGIMRRHARPGSTPEEVEARKAKLKWAPRARLQGPPKPRQPKAPPIATFEDDPEWVPTVFISSHFNPVTPARRPPGLRDRPSKPSQYRGVSRFTEGRGWWRAQLAHEGVKHHLGLFSTEEEAARAYDAKAISLGLLDRLNFAQEAVA